MSKMMDVIVRWPEGHRTLSKLLFIAAGSASFVLSVWLWFIAGDRETGLYVGLWVPSLFALGALVTSIGEQK